MNQIDILQPQIDALEIKAQKEEEALQNTLIQLKTLKKQRDGLKKT